MVTQECVFCNDSGGEILFEDPYLFDTDYHLKLRLSALTFDFEGYSEEGGELLAVGPPTPVKRKKS